VDDVIEEAEPAAAPDTGQRGVSRWMIVTGLIAAVALVVLGVGGFWLKTQIDPSGGPGQQVSVDIPRGSSTAEIAALLAEKDVITSARIFRLYLKVKGGGPFQAGLYRLRENSAMGDVLDTLDDGPALPPATFVTVPEGLVLAQIAKRVAKAPNLKEDAFLAATKSGQVRSRYQAPGQTSLEGLLFPDTYRVEERQTEVDVLRTMVSTFDDVAASIGYDDAKARTGYSAYQVITVASLVEAEAKDDSDRAKIARVIYNRLARGMPLGIDATFYFTLPLERRGTALRQSDLDRAGPYNTRQNAGLVPTPIMAPGKASLEAALNPEAGDWLFYVLKDHRTHAFSSDYNQFLRDKRAAQEKGLL
jgi:UPF0755 protein